MAAELRSELATAVNEEVKTATATLLKSVNAQTELLHVVLLSVHFFFMSLPFKVIARTWIA